MMLTNRKKLFTPVVMMILTAAILLSNVPFVYSESNLSALGYGLPVRPGNARAAGMGFASLGVHDSLSLNYRALSVWEPSILTRYSFSGNYTSISAEDVSGSDVSSSLELTGVTAAIPIKQGWLFGFALTPYTRQNYRWEQQGAVSWSATQSRQQASGGISQTLVGVSLPLTEGYRLGIASRVVFGSIKKTWSTTFPSGDGVSATSRTTDRVAGVGVSLSGRWIGKTGWNIAGYLDTPVSSTVDRHREVYEGGTNILSNTSPLTDDYNFPWDIGIGASKKIMENHLLAAQLGYQAWGQVDVPSTIDSDYKDALNFSLGWELQRQYRLYSPFWTNLTYRAGFYYDQIYAAQINGDQTAKSAFTAGVSIPYFNRQSRMDIALEYGWMGDKAKVGVAENFIGIYIGFSHSEQWFVRKRDREK